MESVHGGNLIVAIHQPNYLPNLAFFRKLAQSDVFVILDDVQYRRRGYINRNRIKTCHGVQWLTIPVLSKGKYHARIGELTPNWSENWCRTHLRTIEHSYRRAAYFDEVFALVARPALLIASERRLGLVDTNLIILRAMGDYLGLGTPLRRASEFAVKSRAGARLAELVRRAGGASYLSGVSGLKYIDPESFRASGVQLRYAANVAPVYPQLWGEFQTGLSLLDMLFNCGRETARFLRDSMSRPIMDEHSTCRAS
jgi:hypothetical protein